MALYRNYRVFYRDQTDFIEKKFSFVIVYGQYLRILHFDICQNVKIWKR